MTKFRQKQKLDFFSTLIFSTNSILFDFFIVVKIRAKIEKNEKFLFLLQSNRKKNRSSEIRAENVNFKD